MGRRRDWPELWCGPGDYSARARENADDYKKEAGRAAKRRTAARCPGPAVLYVLARVHVEIREALYSIRGQIHWRLLRHHSRADQADRGRGARGFAQSPASNDEHRCGGAYPGANSRRYQGCAARRALALVAQNHEWRVCYFG